MLRSATARGLVYTTSTFESGGTENKILTLSPGRENHQNRPHRDELGLAVVYCENAKKSGMWLNSHGVSMRGLYYPRGVLPNCCKPRVSARPFWMRLWVETTVAVR